jgi:LDH2 family malate/lactate/ureidoglycolate dehydrogenase
LCQFAAAIFERLGLPGPGAAVVADCLVQANLRGLDSHGVARIPIYAKRLRLGLVNPRPAGHRRRLHGLCLHQFAAGNGAVWRNETDP